jgi:hypothetical protein
VSARGRAWIPNLHHQEETVYGNYPPGSQLDALQRELGRSITETDNHLDELLRQVVALEELAASRWPRSIVVRARLRRELRRSVEHIDGDDFASKRVNTLASGWLERPQAPADDDDHGGRHRR